MNEKFEQRVMDIHEFMAVLKIRSQTTFNKRAKGQGFPEAIEWPPGSRTRGWIRTEVDKYLDGLLSNPRRWSDIPEQPPAGVVLDRQNAQQA